MVFWRSLTAVWRIKQGWQAQHQNTIIRQLRHFYTMRKLKVFNHAKMRYREAVDPSASRPINLEQLVDLITIIFQREVFSFGKDSLVLYQIWLEAGRRTELRNNVSASIRDQIDEWNNIYQRLKGVSSNNFGFFVLALFVGKIVRLLSQGGEVSSLLPVRKEFSESMADLITRSPIQV